jgi:soluble lytic murein transglycosylase-like protein
VRLKIMIMFFIFCGCINGFCSVPAISIRSKMISLIKHVVANPAKEQIYLSMARIESNFDPSIIGLAGELGLFQIQKLTVYNPEKKIKFKCLGKRINIDRALRDPTINTLCAIEYYEKLENLYPGRPVEEIIYAYNGGPQFASDNPYKCDLRKKYKKGQACLHVKKFALHYYFDEF